MKEIGFLFDLDGVILDTEPQYNVFWGGQFMKYYPDQPDLHFAIKGQTLGEIYNRFFPDRELQNRITEELNLFERDMPMPWVSGFPDFARQIQAAGFKALIVTSSNKPKMNSVFCQHPDLRELVSGVISSEDFSTSKPSPECYLKGAERLGLSPCRCIAFEDSVNGLTSASRAKTKVVGLTTSMAKEHLSELHLADLIIPDFSNLILKNLLADLKMQ